jgi:cytochrome P450
MTPSQVADEPVQLDEAFFHDPHAVYARLRGDRPVFRAVTPLGLPVWVVTGYDGAKGALNDPRLSKDYRRFGDILERHFPDPATRVRFADSLSVHMLTTDPPDHTRLRKLVNPAFTGRAIAALRPRIEQIATGLVDAMADGVAAGEHTVDLLDAFAFPLPMTVICEILGVRDDDRDQFRVWSNTVLSFAPAAERIPAAAAMTEYLTRLVSDRRSAPGDDMLSAIVQATEDADRLSEVEAVSMAFLLLVAGHETTVNLIGNGMLALLTHPRQLAELRENPDLARAAVEEFLRFDGPLNTATFRHTIEPVTIAGTEIPAGEVVLVALAGANRDPEHYSGADDLDLHREPAHLAFGYGIHHCLGAPLARLEGDIAFRTLVGRFPEMTLAVDPAELTWRPSALIHGLDRLPVRLVG